jgi:crotonobetainyl-CoA:carnitine CoA-transferase CaiB-like acyl-CoA transferase
MAGSLPLSGIKVLDLSRVLAGPTCGMVLGDFGADVIKLEHPVRGDDTRDWGSRIGQNGSAYHHSVNRNKRSVAADLGTAEGQGVARALARDADVVIQNFKAGGAERLGLGFADLTAEKPDLIYCSISGYDPSGSEATRPGYDLVIQGEAGLMALNGEPTQPPLKFGVAVVDMFTGMYAAQAVLAALFERQRTGRGKLIQMALFDCGLMISAYYGLEALMAGSDPARCGNEHPSVVPYGVFDAADGKLVITVGNNAQFARFCREIIDRPALADDPRFITNVARSANRVALSEILRVELGRRSRETLLAGLARAGIPCGEVLGLHAALTSVRARDSGLVTMQPIGQPGGNDGSAPVLAPPYRLDGARLPVRRPPPGLGQHTEEILARLWG